MSPSSLAALLALPLTFASCVAGAAPCADPNALGTSRILPLDVESTPRVGKKQFSVTLPLAAKEVVLTFDDGPWPATTGRVLDALKAECVQATFFLVGRNAAAYPAFARREIAEGHTIGYHTYSHPLLEHLTLARAEAEIDRGIAAIDNALGRRAPPMPPFFRFPGFASNAALLDLMRRRGMVVFGADFWASDWNPMTSAEELALVLARLEQAGRGIVLFHDTKSQTAGMIPAFLRALKARGYHIVHVVPSGQ